MWEYAGRRPVRLGQRQGLLQDGGRHPGAAGRGAEGGQGGAQEGHRIRLFVIMGKRLEFD